MIKVNLLHIALLSNPYNLCMLSYLATYVCQFVQVKYKLFTSKNNGTIHNLLEKEYGNYVGR